MMGSIYYPMMDSICIFATVLTCGAIIVAVTVLDQASLIQVDESGVCRTVRTVINMRGTLRCDMCRFLNPAKGKCVKAHEMSSSSHPPSLNLLFSVNTPRIAH
jgi:hypothetical protein